LYFLALSKVDLFICFRPPAFAHLHVQQTLVLCGNARLHVQQTLVLCGNIITKDNS